MAGLWASKESRGPPFRVRTVHRQAKRMARHISCAGEETRVQADGPRQAVRQKDSTAGPLAGPRERKVSLTKPATLLRLVERSCREVFSPHALTQLGFGFKI